MHRGLQLQPDQAASGWLSTPLDTHPLFCVVGELASLAFANNPRRYYAVPDGTSIEFHATSTLAPRLHTSTIAVAGIEP